MTFTFSLFSIAVLGLAVYFLASQKKSQLAAVTWEQLVSKLEAIPMEGITRVATDYLQPRKGQLAIETDEMWFLIGEEQGLMRMEANADVLIALAAFASQWNFEESVIVAERMRRDGLALRHAVRKLALGRVLGDKTTGPFYVQEAASRYWLMRERLLALYETSHAGRYPRLAAAL